VVETQNFGAVVIVAREKEIVVASIVRESDHRLGGEVQRKRGRELLAFEPRVRVPPVPLTTEKSKRIGEHTDGTKYDSEADRDSSSDLELKAIDLRFRRTRQDSTMSAVKEDDVLKERLELLQGERAVAITRAVVHHSATSLA